MEEVEAKKITIWRIFAYFIIYSFIGFLIETVYALVIYGVVESRQSFLYGPFCAIYGLGAVIMICALQRFKEEKYTLFFGGFLVGSVTEYAVSFVGEKLFNTRWWDYSDKFLNLNGRISLVYSIFWGLLAIYLLSIVNPRVDSFIDWLKTKINIRVSKIITIFIMIFLLVDCILSGIAIDFYLTRVSIENNLEIANIEKVTEKYNYIYKENSQLSEIVYKFWGDKKMVKTYPNITITLANGETILAKHYVSEIEYYYKFRR